MSAVDPSPSWTIQRVLSWTQQFFRDKGIESARLDAEVLLAAVLDTNRVYLYTHYDKPLSTEERDAFRAIVKRRAAREPVAQILGAKEFFSRRFRVTRQVMAPRPETEHLVDAVLDRLRGLEAPVILDLGTGSGAIAVTLACEHPSVVVLATDISAAALEVARENAAAHGVSHRVELLPPGDLFAPAAGRGPFDVIVSNPPYVDLALRQELEPEVRDWEPPEALFAGDGGLAIIQRLCEGAPALLRRSGLLALELGFDQHEAVSRWLNESGQWKSIEVRRDLQGHCRVLTAFVQRRQASTIGRRP